MNTLLIQASGYRENGRLDRRKSRWLLGMTLPYVAALTPSDIRVEIKDDMLMALCFGATNEGAERAEIGAREILKRQELGANFRRVAGTAELLDALGMPPNALLVLPASMPGLDSGTAERLVADWQGPVLVVR